MSGQYIALTRDFCAAMDEADAVSPGLAAKVIRAWWMALDTMGASNHFAEMSDDEVCLLEELGIVCGAEITDIADNVAAFRAYRAKTYPGKRLHRRVREAQATGGSQ